MSHPTTAPAQRPAHRGSDATRLARAVRTKALDLGFQRAGISEAGRPEESRHFDRWLSDGMHGEMRWMMRGRERRLDPTLVLEGTRSIVVVALAYASPGSTFPKGDEKDGPRGVVSRYALGDDYHRVAGDRLLELQKYIEGIAPGHVARAYIDTGPVLERLWAARAGIGWIGKNALVLNKEMGSYFFLGVVLTTLALAPDEPAFDQCGSCTLCLEACPTGAIMEPRLVDSRRCLSYHTIELRGPLPEEHLAAMADRVFGCDECQEICPWNRGDATGGPGGASADFPPRPGSTAPLLRELLAMSHEQYLKRFRGSAIKRATYAGLRRNAAAALGNVACDAEALVDLERVASDPDEDPVLRRQATVSSRHVKERLDQDPSGR